MANLTPSGNLVTPVGFDPNGLLLPVQVDANGYLLISIEDFDGVAGTMLDPKGNLVSPVGFDPSGNILPLQVTAAGYLRVSAQGLQEDIEDIAAAMITGGVQSGITVTYDDANGEIDFTVPASASYQLMGANGNAVVIPAGATRYFVPFMDGLITVARTAVITKSGTARNMFIRTASAQPASGSLVYTLTVSGVATALTITIPAGSAAGDYSITGVDVAIPQFATIKVDVVNNAATNSAAQGSFAFEFEFD